MIKKLILALVLILGIAMYLSTTRRLYPNAASIPSMGSPVTPEWGQRAGQAIRETMAAQNLPGVSVAVAVGGEIIWEAGFGYADLGAGQPVTPDVRFRIGTDLPGSPGVADDDHDFPLFNMARELIYDPRTRPGTVRGPAVNRATYYFPRFAGNPNYGIHRMRPLENQTESTPAELVRLARAGNLPGELLGGRVMSLMSFPEHNMAVCVMSNIAYADTAALASEIANLAR